MLLEILITVLIGCLAGTLTGLIPGLHTNTISILILSLSGFLIGFINGSLLAAFIISMSVTNTFTSIIPSVFLGCPNSDTAMNVLPGHMMLKEGRALEAIKINLLGSLIALIYSAILFLPIIYIIPFFYEFIRNNLFYILLIVSIFLLLKEKNRLAGLYVFLISGILGFFALNSSLEEPLLPLLTGFFGLSGLLISIKDENSIPRQKNTSPVLEKNIIWSSIIGQLLGFLISVIPGIGSSTAAAVGMNLIRKTKENFLFLTGMIGTTNFILSLITMYALNKARNGSIVVLQKLIMNVNFNNLILFLGITLLSGILALVFTIEISKIFAKLMERVNYKLLIFLVIGFLILLVFILTNIQGLIILIISTSIGFIPALGKTSRGLMMGSILIPVMIFFI